jgi:wyosine [tRNA(Phe)-imidazoG37] synthetase (radical SAM superfamily)
MSSNAANIVFGPVPSRRLGRSLGINNIPPKFCSYSCVYCQVGPTRTPQLQRQRFYSPAVIEAQVRRAVERSRAAGERIDYLTFVPDGEPTLDLALGEAIARLRPLGVPIAVISNGSLTSRADVREALASADLVSLKVDSVDEASWRRINQPHAELDLGEVLEGMRRFAGEFGGMLLTETMLVAGINDAAEGLERTAAFIAELQPAHACLAVPTRPPAASWVRPPDESVLASAYAIFLAHDLATELLVDFEDEITFAPSDTPAADLLAITAVHPMRETEVRQLLVDSGADWAIVDDLLRKRALRRVEHGGHTFYLRPLPAEAHPRARRGGPNLGIVR